MNRPVHAPNRPAEDQNDLPVSREELDTIRERDKTYPRDRQDARPDDEVVTRLLSRYPTP